MKRLVIGVLIGIAFYTRLVGISWGLPYPMHPDERNMAVAVQSLKISEGLNPHFFAYGQFPLYIAYFIIQFSSLVLYGNLTSSISFEIATITLRYISALSSLASLWILYRLLKDFFPDYFDRLFLPLALVPFIFLPSSIQFAHFGTTESMLTTLYLGIVYFTLRIGIAKKITHQSVVMLGVLAGLAIGTKISSMSFLGLPVLVMLWILLKTRKTIPLFVVQLAKNLLLLLLITAFFSLIASPHMLLSTTDFLSSIVYESNIASGSIQVFYTRQFLYSIPIAYQILNIFPVALGHGMFFLFFGGLIFLPWKDCRTAILRGAFMLYFIPSSFLFVKWTRFEAPILPITALIGILFLNTVLLKIRKEKIRTILFVGSIMIFSVQGIAYLSIYRNEDIRFQASEWIYKHITEQDRVFSEAGNVINIPVPFGEHVQNIPNIPVENFDFYQVDTSEALKADLIRAKQEADYIIVPSRRVLGSVTCSLHKEKYNRAYAMNRCTQLARLFPVTNDYYDKLLSGALGYSEIKRFTAYPRIELFGKTLIEFPDEQYDETWSVFDHPVVRIYKRT